LSDEIGDLWQLVQSCREASLTVQHRVFKATEAKRQKLLKYMQTMPETKA
jgi:hypothetical protein